MSITIVHLRRAISLVVLTISSAMLLGASARDTGGTCGTMLQQACTGPERTCGCSTASAIARCRPREETVFQVRTTNISLPGTICWTGPTTEICQYYRTCTVNRDPCRVFVPTDCPQPTGDPVPEQVACYTSVGQCCQGPCANNSGCQ